MKKMRKKAAKSTNNVWYIALIVLGILIFLGVLTLFILIKILPSEVQIEVKKAGLTVTILGGVAFFIVLFKVFFGAYTKILSLLNITAIVYGAMLLYDLVTPQLPISQSGMAESYGIKNRKSLQNIGEFPKLSPYKNSFSGGVSIGSEATTHVNQTIRGDSKVILHANDKR